MIAVIQRVARASVTVESPDFYAEIGAGLCVFLGVAQDDTEEDAAWTAGKIARLRIFRDEVGKMNRSVQEIAAGNGGAGEVLLVSQFTLAGDCAKGNRPSFVRAAAPELGEALYEKVAEHLRRDHNLMVKTGVFGAMMLVEIANDGPVTLIVQR